MAAVRVHALQDESLAALVWRALGFTSGAVETVLEANPGLAVHAEALPQGYAVTIPGLAQVEPQADAQLVQLWD